MSAEAKPNNTAQIVPGMFCKACGWPVIHACCNDEMASEPWGADYWGYCSNKGCENHEGEEWDQSDPDFAFRTEAGQTPARLDLEQIKALKGKS